MAISENMASEVLQVCRLQNISFIHFAFTDLAGKFQFLSFNSDNISEKELLEGVYVDIGNNPTKGDNAIFLKPDLNSYYINPFTSHPTLVLICDIIMSSGEPFLLDPRSLAQRCNSLLTNYNIGDNALFKVELEYFIFNKINIDIDDNKSSFLIEKVNNSGSNYDQGNYEKSFLFSLSHSNNLGEIISEISMVSGNIGIKNKSQREIDNNGLCSITLDYNNLLGVADNIQKFKYVAKNIAASFGKIATFMPKPLYNHKGAGINIEHILKSGDKNLFLEALAEPALSETGLYYIGGIIKHIKLINAFSNSTLNSYKRLEILPKKIFYKNSNLSFKFADSASNPYLSFAAILIAGLDGIRNKIKPVEALEEKINVEEKFIFSPANSLREALEQIEENRELLIKDKVFTEELIDAYINLKLIEIYKIENNIHPAEIGIYYNI